MYLELALVGDVTTLTDIGITYIESSIEGYTARPGNVETIMIESSGQMMAELIDQASIVPAEAFASLGTSVFGVPMLDGQQAIAPAVITWATDTPATMLPVDSEVAVPNPDGNMYVFTTDRDLPAIQGGGAATCFLLSRDVGTAPNNSFGDCQMIDEVEGVASIVAQPAVDGTDDETAEEYLDRLTTIISLLAPRPILPSDHAALASTVPGVGRVSVLNLYYPGTTVQSSGQAIGDYALWTPQPPPAAPQSNVPRCTTVCIMADDFTAPDTLLMQAVYDILNNNREVNFMNFVMKPTYVDVDLKAVVTPYPNRIKQEAIDGSTQMVEEWLSAASYGVMPGGDDSEGWASDTKLRLYEAVDFLNRGPATWYVENVALKFSTDSTWAPGDLDMSGKGVFPVPILKTLTLT